MLLKNEFIPDFTKIRKQSEAWHALQDPEVEELLYGGAKGGGKSVFGCYWSYIMAYSIAQKYFKEPPEHPLAVGFMGRKVAKNFTDTTLGTWKRFIPANRYRIVGKPAEIFIANRVKIQTGGLDRSEDVQKFNSAELAFGFIDQAEETTMDDIMALRASMRLTINGESLPYKLLFTANPRQCWLKTEFILNRDKDKRFVQALPGDNPLLPKSYVPKLKSAFKHRPELLQAYLYGDWSALEGSDNVIKDRWIEAASKVKFHPHKQKHLIACDVARYGDDETVILHLIGTQIIWEDCIIFGKKPITDTAGAVRKLSERLGGVPCVIEEDALGGSVIDILKGLGEKNVYGIVPGSASSEPEKYVNKRAEIWDNAAQMYSEHEVQLNKPAPEQIDDYLLLRNQLCIPRYKFRGAKLLISSKDEIKAELGRSPDRADAYVLGLYGLKWARQPMKELKKVKRDKYDEKPRTTVWAG